MKRAVVGVWVMLMFTAAMPVFAQVPSAKDLMKEMKSVFRPSRPSVRDLEIVSTDAKGTKTSFKAAQVNGGTNGERHMLIVIQEPFDSKGVAFLASEQPNEPMLLHVYLPTIKKVKKIIGMSVYDSFLATDFTYADIVFVPEQEPCRLLGDEQLEGVKTYKLEETVTQDKAVYSRIVTWIAADTKLPLRRDYFDRAGKIWKRELFKNIVVIDGMPTPMNIVMKDLQNNSTTEVKVGSVKNDGNVSDELFMPEYLSRASESPVWALLKNTQAK